MTRDNRQNRSYDSWEASADEFYTGDPLWRVRVYRRAAYLAELADDDVVDLARNAATRLIAGQLARAVGSVMTSISEGYSRTSTADRTRIYEFGLGSARESRDWYRRGRYVLGPVIIRSRIAELTSIIRMLLSLIKKERQRKR